MRLIFAGTPAFAGHSLARLIEAGHDVVLVLTQPDRPAGRGMRDAASPVKTLALQHGLWVMQPVSLRDEHVTVSLRAARADAMVVAAYGQLLPPAVLDCTRHGAINIHASLLPRWRGAAPIQRALLAGDAETGVSIMRMDAGLDTGPVFLQRRLPIGRDDDAGSLHDKLAGTGAEALLQVLAEIEASRARAEPQPAQGATYARKIDKAETLLDWRQPAQALERAVRAFRPAPGAVARLGGQAIKVWRARVIPGSGDPGTVVASDHGVAVACGAEILVLEEVQPAGGRRMAVGDFLHGHPVPPGTRFE